MLSYKKNHLEHLVRSLFSAESCAQPFESFVSLRNICHSDISLLIAFIKQLQIRKVTDHSDSSNANIFKYIRL